MTTLREREMSASACTRSMPGSLTVVAGPCFLRHAVYDRERSLSAGRDHGGRDLLQYRAVRASTRTARTASSAMNVPTANINRTSDHGRARRARGSEPLYRGRPASKTAQVKLMHETCHLATLRSHC